MKKFTLVLVMLLSALYGHAQIVLQQDFEGAGPDIPTSWSETGLSTDDFWSVGDAVAASSDNLNIPTHTNFAYTNDDRCNCDKSADRLITPSMDVSGYNSLEMNFDYYFRDGMNPSFTIEASTDGGATWTELTSLNRDQTWHNNQSIDLSAYAGESDLKISFLFNDGGIWAYAAGIDNIVIQGVGAITPDANNILYVNKAATGNGSGDSWANALTDVQAAIDAATAGDKIFVKKGEYTLTASIFMKEGVKMYGSFAGTETSLAARDLSGFSNNAANATILKSNGGQRVISNVFTSGSLMTSASVLDGFVLTEGYDPFDGGGIYNSHASPTLSHLIISGNEAGQDGGGIYNTNSSSPALTNLTILGNTASRDGGGMANNNSSPVLTNVTIHGNSVPVFGGGGMYNANSSSPTLTNTLLLGNTGGIQGIYNNSSSTTITYSLVQGVPADATNQNLDGTTITTADVFTDVANGDYTLNDGAVVINAGDNTSYTNAGGDLTNDTDLAGNLRVFQNTIDIGAYEYQTLIITPDANNILYVDKSVSGSNGNGNSWANALPELADALVWAKENETAWSASIDSLQIYVAGGTYKPLYSPADNNFGNDAGRDNSFLMVNNVQLYGGFAGTESALSERDLSLTANKTILSGDVNDDDVVSGSGSTLSITNNTENNYHVVVSAGPVSAASLNGLTITGGNADDFDILTVNTITIVHSHGGGMYNYSSNPTLTNVTISGNNAEDNGGGIHNRNSSPNITNSIFRENVSGSFGAGMGNDESSPNITNTSIIGNKAGPYAGGIYNISSSPVLINTTISGNYAFARDGIFNTNLSPIGSNPKIYNSIVWGSIYNAGSSTTEIKNSIIKGSSDVTNGNINATNLTDTAIFNDPANADYSLNAFGPALNAGDNTLYIDAGGNLSTDKDLAGNARLFAGIPNPDVIDLGAYEYQGEPLTITPTAGILYVNKTATGNGSGNSWENAIPELADALVWAKENETEWSASIDSLQIYVAGGTYKPLYSPADNNFGNDAGRDNTFLMVNNVQLYGSFAGTEIDLSERDLSLTANETTLSGDFDEDDVISGSGETLSITNISENAYHVVVSSGEVSTARLDGFIISGGNANSSIDMIINTNSLSRKYGGGMSNRSSSPSVNNVSMSGNTATYGGGVSNYNSNSTYTNVILSGNFGNSDADSSGGGMFNTISSPSLDSVTFNGNISNYGGGMFNSGSFPNLTNVTLSDNFADNNGGGISNSYSSPILSNVTLSGNSAANGGGMYNISSSPTMTNVTLSDNLSSADGGGIYNYSSSPILSNVTISGNSADSNGGGMYNDGTSSPNMTNVTLSGNSANTDGGGIYNEYNSSPSLTNTILWGNTADNSGNGIVNGYQSTPTITYSLIQGIDNTSNNGLDGTDNSNAPRFVDADNSDYTLQITSPAINAGSNTAYTDTGGDLDSDVDVAGNTRLYDGTPATDIIDMGAYEFQGDPITPDANNILYVNKTATGNSSGDSWTNAIPELADALFWANNNKAEFETTPLQIWVAGGTYKPMYSPEDGNFGNDADRDNSFLMVNNVQLYGGFAGTETALSDRDLSLTANETILSGDVNGDDILISNSSTFYITNNTENNFHVVMTVNSVDSVSLNGFTITGGNADGTSTITVNNYGLYNNTGGGIFNHNATPLLINSVITGNTADGGGGIYNANANTILTNVSFSKNIANFGGGMFNNNSNTALTNVIFDENKAINENSCADYNSEYSCNNYGNNCVWNFITDICEREEEIGGKGGGLYNTDSSPVLTNVTFSKNQADVSGGGVYSENSSPGFYNNLILGNIADTSGSGIYNENSTPVIEYSLIQNLTDTSDGNIDATGILATDVFTDTANNDFTLKTGSIVVNAGNNTAYTNADGDLSNDIDLAGNPRVFQNTIDLGAYESQVVTITPDVNNILYVDKSNTAGDGSGASWASALPELADALIWAKENETSWSTSIDSLQIYVAKGTYKPLYSPADDNFGNDAGRNNSFLMVNNVQIYGGFDPANNIVDLSDARILPTEEGIVSGSILSGEIGTPNDLTDNTYQVFISSGSVGTAILDGFSITRGYANVYTDFLINGNQVFQCSGAGVYNSVSSPEYKHILLFDNTCTESGGGMFSYQSSPSLQLVSIKNNQAKDGGGMANQFNSFPTLLNVSIQSNTASENGSGMYNVDQSSATLTNVSIVGNSATVNSEEVSGCVSDNSEVILNNSIIWDAISGDYIAQNSLIKDSNDTSNGNLDATGLVDSDVFTDPDNGDYSLKFISPAVNVGDNSLYTSADGDLVNDLDLAGNPRLFGTTIDMGAFEFQGESGYIWNDNTWTPANPQGNATAQDDIFVMNGTTNFTQALEVNSITVMTGATLNVEDVLTIHGDITNNGNLIFKSTATKNGELAQVSATSTISGAITVERYMKNKRSYRMVSSAVTTTSSIHDNWQEGATSNTDNPNTGFGTHITGSTTDQMNGFDGTITGNSSMFTVNVGTQQFEAIANTDMNTLTAGSPYLLFVRGDRGVDLGDNLASSETVLRATGSLVTGTNIQSFGTVIPGDFAMFGNPYQSAVDINSVFATATNVNPNMFYVYDPSLGDHGSYVTVSLPAGTNTANSDVNQYLQPGQGAQFATVGYGWSSVEFNEADKVPGNFTATSRPMAANDMLTVQLFTTENFNNGGPVHDSFGIVFAEENDNGITPADAIKPMNFYENLGVNNNGTYLSIEQRALPQAAEVYPMYTTGYTKSDYTLKVVVDGLEANSLYLNDHFTGISILLEAGENAYSFRVDANNPLSIATDRFSIRTEQRLGVDDNSLLAGIRLFPNPLNGDTFYINAPKLNGEQLAVSISDLAGRTISEHSLNCQANTVTVPMAENIASGVYLVTLKHGGVSSTFRLLKE